MTNIPSPLADAFAALAAGLRARAQAGTGQGAQAAWHALVLLGLARLLWVLESMARHTRAPRAAAPAGHLLLADAYLRAATRRPLTARLHADWRSFRRPPQDPPQDPPVRLSQAQGAAPVLPHPSHARPAPRRPLQAGPPLRARPPSVPGLAPGPVPWRLDFSKTRLPPAPSRVLYVA